ncbi:hypothetical protein K488DRAFT_59916 [Vararia minispora EC-137]|uniref:Uncharacterized protein n=1 Tax=Vararia minispora EC-137 TaxID=1314806 RepID=A0ACB8Q847_9AGAM|nr:hypothetical protein K488DRAFT_59916 [Vararia minispora EC-137]
MEDRLYNPSEDDKIFLKSLTGIKDEDKLEKHVISIQQEALKVYPYPCIIFYDFIKPYMARIPAYPDVLHSGRACKGAVLVDLGCGFGNNIRKAVLDGWPVENCVATDLRAVFWEYGHKLFRSTPETFPASFIQGSILDPTIIAEHPPLSIGSDPPTQRPSDLRSLTSLNHLRGHVFICFAGYFFHLFTYDDQARLARALAGLLSPVRGATILGLQVSTGKREPWSLTLGYALMSHSVESWEEMWKEAFRGCEIHVVTNMRPRQGNLTVYGLNSRERGETYYIMEWLVTRR